MKYTHRDKYYNTSGQDMLFENPNGLRCVTSSKNSGGNGSRNDPYHKYTTLDTNNGSIWSLDGGYFDRLNVAFSSGKNYVYGINPQATKIKLTGRIGPESKAQITMQFQDLTFCGGAVLAGAVNLSSANLSFKNCVIEDVYTISGDPASISYVYFWNCICKTPKLNSFGILRSYSKITYLTTEIDASTPVVSATAFDRCDIIADEAFFTARQDSYLSFDNCRFQFPGENDFTELTGSTPQQLRAGFAARAEAAGLTCNLVSECGEEDVKMGKWIFTKGNSYEGVIYKGSDIHAFETARGFFFGYSADRADMIKITNDVTKANSVNPNNPNALVRTDKRQVVDFNEDKLKFNSYFDLAEKQTFFVQSNIIPLGEKKEINSVLTPHNLPWLYGMAINSENNLMNGNGEEINPGEEKIENGAFYLLRSKDGLLSVATYNGKDYNSGLMINKNNVIQGSAVKYFTAKDGQPVLYKIRNERQFQIVQIRVVNEIPSTPIISGNLHSNYWYLVDGGSGTNDYIEYDGKRYYRGSSFLTKSKLTFTRPANSTVYLLRCWNEGYDNPDNEAIEEDKAFWANRQKPKWISVLPHDMRCFLKYNNPYQDEMQKDITDAEYSQGKNFNYIATGHERFYNEVVAGGGIPKLDFPIRGAFVQIRVQMLTHDII